jgi:hypothetical protein
MSYLLQYATRRPTSFGRLVRRARVDENLRLNLPGFYGDAYVRVFVGNTSTVSLRRNGELPSPRLRLRIADCENTIQLEFSLDTAGERENALHKIDTLLGSLQRFRDAMAAEARLCAQREYRAEEACRL